MDLKREADCGDSKACYQYGYFLANEKNNPEEAAKYYQKGIERNNNASCLFALGEAIGMETEFIKTTKKLTIFLKRL